mmetsp:Transcript_6411/g.12735  ORF Transcript_6411/g.12735 Transcript_6411/m.12735 type:complete len:87 (-) Transcript_6411:326-586(-)
MHVHHAEKARQSDGPSTDGSCLDRQYVQLKNKRMHLGMNACSPSKIQMQPCMGGLTRFLNRSNWIHRKKERKLGGLADIQRECRTN